MDDGEQNKLVKAASLDLAKFENTGSLAARGLAALVTRQRTTPGNQLNLSALEKAATQGNVNAQFEVAEAYAFGTYSRMNDAVWETICALGDVDGVSVGSVAWTYGLAKRSKNADLSADQDDCKAARWYLLAALQGHVGAQFYLAGRYAIGCGVERDDVKALAWYCKAAEQENAAAQFRLGLMFAQGCGIERDDGLAIAWYQKAAKLGNPDAQTKLGLSYRSGIGGVEIDFEESVNWLRLAAEQNQRHAQFYLGEMYANGSGVDRDEDLALAWYRRAADHGHEGAIKLVGKSNDKQST